MRELANKISQRLLPTTLRLRSPQISSPPAVAAALQGECTDALAPSLAMDVFSDVSLSTFFVLASFGKIQNSSTFLHIVILIISI